MRRGLGRLQCTQACVSAIQQSSEADVRQPLQTRNEQNDYRSAKQTHGKAAAGELDGVDRATYGKWDGKELEEYQSVRWRNFAESSVVCTAEDCARLGKPAREMLYIVAQDNVDDLGSARYVFPSCSRVPLYKTYNFASM